MQMRRCNAAGISYLTHRLALPGFLAGDDVELGEMGVIGFVAVAMIHDYQAAVSAISASIHHDTVSGGLGRGAYGSGNIHTRVISAFTRERIRTLPVAAHQQTIHRPDAGPCIHVPVVRIVKAGEVRTAQVIVFRDGFGKSRNELALRRDIAWPLELVLDPVS